MSQRDIIQLRQEMIEQSKPAYGSGISKQEHGEQNWWFVQERQQVGPGLRRAS